jgi:hypothetical protein
MNFVDFITVIGVLIIPIVAVMSLFVIGMYKIFDPRPVLGKILGVILFIPLMYGIVNYIFWMDSIFKW